MKTIIALTCTLVDMDGDAKSLLRTNTVSFIEMGTRVSTTTSRKQNKVEKLLRLPTGDNDERLEVQKQMRQLCKDKDMEYPCMYESLETVNHKFQLIKSQLALVLFTFGLCGGLVAISGGTRKHVTWGVGTLVFFSWLAYQIIITFYMGPLIMFICMVWGFMTTISPLFRFATVAIMTLIWSIIMFILKLMFSPPFIMITICILIIYFIFTTRKGNDQADDVIVNDADA